MNFCGCFTTSWCKIKLAIKSQFYTVCCTVQCTVYSVQCTSPSTSNYFELSMSLLSYLHNIQCYNENSVLFCIYCVIYIYFSIFLTVSFHSILTRDEQDFTISVSGSSCSYPFYALCSLLFSLFLFLDIP